MRIGLHLASSILTVAVFVTATALAADGLDKYGGGTDVQGAAGEYFSVQKIGNRWWIVTPEGHGTFIRTVSKVDTNSRNVDCGGSGNYLSYDAAYIVPNGGQATANLKDAAASSIAKDVVDAKTGLTLKDAGDVFIFGSARFKPNFSYLWCDQLGTGGKVQWYYSAGKDWKLINGDGNPFKTENAQNTDRSYSFDIGNYIALDAIGNGAWDNKGAIRLAWFDLAKVGFPPDFAPMALPNDPEARYYIKAVVTQAFTTGPVLNQIYDRAMSDETMQRKYGPGDWNLTWAKAITERLKGWGYNAAGMYSGRYLIGTAAKLGDDRLPGEPTWAVGGWAIKKDKYHVKNVYSGAIFPPGSGNTGWHGIQPDVFDPNFETAYMEQIAAELPKLDTWSWSLISEEADYLFGLNSQTHDHMGYVILAHNPFRAKDSFDNTSYTDPRFYGKYALRDFLRDRYKAAGETIAPFTMDSKVPAYTFADKPEGGELAALESFNKAWGTHYTTWGTSQGDLQKGTNAWGTGTGFMDENGASVLAKGARNASFGKDFTKADFPAIRKDFDDFLVLFATRYGKILNQACNQGKHPPLILPLYQGPDIVYKAIAPYVDGFWFSSITPTKEALRIYNASHKPVIFADYLTAQPDSPNYFKGKIEKISYDPATKKTTIYAPTVEFKFRTIGHFVCFPDSPKLNKPDHWDVISTPRPTAVHWNTFEFAGDFTPYVKPGETVAFSGAWRTAGEPGPVETQALRAKQMIEAYDSVLNLKGDDGNYFVIGFEHWCLYDDGVNNWGEVGNFGIATLQDNAYDGVEARRLMGKDARGFLCGGEQGDYGNLLGPLSEYLRSIPGKIQK